MASKEISIYSKSAHIIERNKIPKLILPSSTDISSILILDSKNNTIPFVIDKDTYFEANERVIVTKNGLEYTGSILNIDDRNITIFDGTIKRIQKYDSVTNIKSFDSGLKLQIGSAVHYTISYLVSDISWTCVGTATIDKNKMQLHISANINNDLGNDFQGACKLIAGNVNQYIKPRMNMMMKEMSVSAQSSQPAESSALEDYVSYDIGYKNLQKQNMFELVNIPLDCYKIYTHITQSGVVNYGYTCKPSIFIPKCHISLYEMKDGKINSFIGSTNIRETQKNNIINMYIGESTLVECKSIVTSMTNIDEVNIAKYKLPNKGWQIVFENVSADIRNLTQDPISLKMKHYVGTRTILDNTQCNNYTRTSEGYIEWDFEIKPSTDIQKFSCQLTMGESY